MKSEEAGTFQRNCTNGGFHDWRFPSESELMNIADEIVRMDRESRSGIYKDEVGSFGVYTTTFKIKMNDLYTNLIHSQGDHGIWYVGYEGFGVVIRTYENTSMRISDSNHRAACILIRNK